MSPIGQLLADNWVWLVGAGLTAMLAYWWWDEREDAESPGETVDGVTNRAEAATGGFLSGFRSLVIGVLGIVGTVAVEMMHLAGDVNAMLGGVPFLVGYLVYGALSFFGVDIGLEQSTLGFVFILILVVGLMAKYGNGRGEPA